MSLLKKTIYGPATLQEHLAELDRMEEEAETKRQQKKELDRTMYDDMSWFEEPKSLIECTENETEPCFEWDEDKEQWIDNRPDAMRELQEQMYKKEDDETYLYLHNLYKRESRHQPASTSSSSPRRKRK